LTLTQTQSNAFACLMPEYLGYPLQGINEVLFGGGAGGGKSALGCFWCLNMALKYKGSRGLIGRAQLKTLRETTLNTFFEIASMTGVSHTFTYIAPTTIRFRNGSEILLKDLFHYPSDPNYDELGSLELTYAFIDEANQITHKAKSIVRSRIRYKLDEFGIEPRILFTCNPAKNWVKKEFFDLDKKGILPRERVFIQSLLHDNPFVYSGYAESLEQLSNVDRQRLLYGNWEYDDSEDSLMKYDAISNIFTNSFVKAEGKKYITADIARMGSDKTIVRVWHGWRVLKRIVITKQPLTVTAQRIQDVAKEYMIPMSQVICDEDGVGGGVVDILRCKGFVANRSAIQQSKPTYNFASLKDQCAYHMASMVNENKVYENAEQDVRELLTAELEQIREKNIDKDGKRRLVPKDEVKQVIGRSPDDADTYIMRAYFDLATVTGFNVVSPFQQGVTNGRTI
jgi:phage terminase large subunit